jgi:hypothetical protein
MMMFDVIGDAHVYNIHWNAALAASLDVMVEFQQQSLIHGCCWFQLCQRKSTEPIRPIVILFM